MKQQIMFQLTENIYLKLDKNIKVTNIEHMNIVENRVDVFKHNFPRLFEKLGKTINVQHMEENIIEIKDILDILRHKYSEYLTNYELENTKTDWKKKLETLVDTLESYNLSEESEQQIYVIIDKIIELDNINCEMYFNEINDIMGIDL
jgi:hypothetical protein